MNLELLQYGHVAARDEHGAMVIIGIDSRGRLHVTYCDEHADGACGQFTFTTLADGEFADPPSSRSRPGGPFVVTEHLRPHGYEFPTERLRDEACTTKAVYDWTEGGDAA